MTARAPRAPAGQAGHATRALFVATATDLFAREGYHGTGVAEILAQSGLSRGSFYHFFKAKQDVLYDVCLMPLEHMCEVGALLASGEAPAAVRFRGLAAALLTDIAANQASWRVYLRDSGHLDEDRQRQIRRLRDQFEEYWAEILASGTRAGEFHEVGPLAVKGILGMFNHAVLWLDPAGSVSAEELSEQYCDILLSGLLHRSGT